MSDKKEFQITGKMVLITFILFFGIIIGVNVVFISKATGTFPGLITQHPFKKGVAYNKTLEQRRAEAKLQWRVHHNITAADDGKEYFIVQVKDANDMPIDGLDVNLHLWQAGNNDADLELQLQPQGNGKYRVEIAQSEMKQGAMRFAGKATRPSDKASMEFTGRL